MAFDATTDDLNLYHLYARSVSNQLEIVSRVRGGSYSACATPASFAFAAGVVYWMRFDVTLGGVLQGRVWRAGRAEPAAWQTSCVDTQLHSGSVGTGLYWGNPQPAAPASGSVYCFAVAPAGQQAQPCAPSGHHRG